MPAVNQASSDIEGALQSPRELLSAVAKDAQRAEALAAAMKKMTTVNSEHERLTIAAKLDEPPAKPPLVSVAKSRRVSTKTLEAIKTKVARQSRNAKAAVAAINAPQAPMETSAYRAKLATDFDVFFKAVRPSDARKKRDELLAEAKVRYANNPATLDALVRYIREEARARGVD